MPLSERDQQHLDAMTLVESVSQSLNSISWIWGGYTTDIYLDRILREHGDLDYLTLNLHQLKSKIAEIFSQLGWQAKDLVNGDLILKKITLKCIWETSKSGTLPSGRITVRKVLSSFPFPGSVMRQLNFME